ncbi:MAG: hypothetical protein WDO68_24730 [Gammaproteobacteria bacterium]
MRPDLNHFSKPPRPPAAVGDIARQLRELSSEAAPPYDFAEFRRRSLDRSAPKRQLITWPHAAAAAGLTAFVAAMALLGTSGGPRPDGSDAAAPGGLIAEAVTPGNTASPASSASAAAGNTGTPAAVVGASDGNVGSPAATVAADSNQDPAEHAREAREWLARQPELALVRAGPRLAVANLEDRIAWFDDALTDGRLQGANAAQLKVIQQERARLVSSLAQVRYAEALVADGS